MSDELANDCIANFSNLLKEGSEFNGDATGVFGDSFTWKVGKAYEDFKKGKVKDLRSYMDKYATNWLVGHNRLATKGSEKDNVNNHPFENSTCVIVHNGVLTNDDALAREHNLVYQEQTDSAVIPALIESFMDKPSVKYLTDDDKILSDKNGVAIENPYIEETAIKRTVELLEGSYSVFVYMKESKRLFYFKNNSTSFYFMRLKDENDNLSYYGSTDKDSLWDVGYIKSDGFFRTDVYKERNIESPDGGVIYEVLYKEKSQGFKEVSTFKPKASTSWGNWNTCGATHYSTRGTTTYKTDDDWIDDDGYYPKKSYTASYEGCDTGMCQLDDFEENLCMSCYNYMYNQGADEFFDYTGDATLSIKNGTLSNCWNETVKNLKINQCEDIYDFDKLIKNGMLKVDDKSQTFTLLNQKKDTILSKKNMSEWLMKTLNASEYTSSLNAKGHRNYAIKYDSIITASKNTAYFKYYSEGVKKALREGELDREDEK